VAWLPRFKTLPARIRIALAALVIILAAAAYLLHLHGTLEHRVAPWLGHIIGTEGMFSSTGEMLGTRPVTLDLFWRTLLSLAVIATAAICLLDTLTHYAKPGNSVGEPHSGLRNSACLLGPFTLCYFCLLVPRGLYSFLYDRYLLGIMPAAVTFVLLLYQRGVRKRLPLWPFVFLAGSSMYVVAATHDWFALDRARIQAVAAVHAAGVPATRIQGGFELDGWTQLENAPSVNWDAIENPPNAYRFYPPETGLAPPCRLDFAVYTPSVQPEYFVVFKPMPCLAPSRFGPTAYRNWLPPHTRYVYIQRRPD
jgi:hypothetical protein